jgi:hypothetical protein
MSGEWERPKWIRLEYNAKGGWGKKYFHWVAFTSLRGFPSSRLRVNCQAFDDRRRQSTTIEAGDRLRRQSGVDIPVRVTGWKTRAPVLQHEVWPS